jgi:hypothetical protein
MDASRYSLVMAHGVSLEHVKEALVQKRRVKPPPLVILPPGSP